MAKTTKQTMFQTLAGQINLGYQYAGKAFLYMTKEFSGTFGSFKFEVIEVGEEKAESYSEYDSRFTIVKFTDNDQACLVKFYEERDSYGENLTFGGYYEVDSTPVTKVVYQRKA